MDSPPSSRSQGWLRRFSSRAPSQAKLTLTLEAELPAGERPSDELRLLVRREGKITAYHPVESSLEPLGSNRRPWARRQRWRLAFELPLSVGEDPHTTLELITDKDPASAPKPEPTPIHERKSSRLGVVLASAAALLAGLAPGFALASGGASSPATPAVSTLSSTVPTQASPTTSSPAPTTSASQHPTATTTSTATQAPGTTTSPLPVTRTTPAPTTTSTTSTTTASTPTTTPTTTTSTTPTKIPTRPGKKHPGAGGGVEVVSGHSGKSRHKAGRRATHKHHHAAGHRVASHHVKHRSGGVSPAAPAVHKKPKPKPQPEVQPPAPVISSGSTWSNPVMSDPFTSKQLAGYAALVGGLAQPPKFLVKIYRAAGHHYGIPWQVLAAINYVETHYGQDLAVSSAGAIGWMQFMPATWAEYGESVNLKGKPSGGMPNPWNPTDAIFAAAHYLTAAGARRNLPKAVYAYNHAGWYVQEVLSIAEQINRHGLRAGSKAKHKIWAMTTMARLLNGLPYVWGGGHSSFSLINDGYDCSGFVSAVLHAAGYLQVPQTTQTLPSQPRIESGPGRWVTIFDRTDAGIGDDHVIINIDGQWWESGGYGVESDRVHRIRKMTAGYLQSFNLVLHPKGL